MGMQLIFTLITILIGNVRGSSVLGSAGPSLSSTSIPTSNGQKRHGALVAAPHTKAFQSSSSIYISPTEAHTHHSNLRPYKGHTKKWIHGSAPSPSISFQKYHPGRKKFGSIAPQPSRQLHRPTYSQQGPLISPFHSPIPSPRSWITPSPEPSPTFPSSQVERPMPPKPVLVLPPPPPNTDCTSVTCTEPLTYTPAAGSPCACVWPIEVRLRLSISPYTFFPLVSELASEIANGVSLNVSQTRIMGANAAGEQLEKTIVLINLVPLKENFDPATTFLIYQKFWRKQVFISISRFGAYDVVYVHYPGLPPSPPSVPSNAVIVDDQPYSGNDNKGRPFKPLGVDVPRRKKNENNGSMIAVVVLSSVSAFFVCMGVLWFLLLKCRACIYSPEQTPHELVSSHEKQSGAARSLTLGSRPSSASLSFDSSILAYTGTAKIFSLNDIERATDHLHASRIIGEGGFGLVYSGILDDGRRVAVKVLKREDQQGSREFLAEVEMLSRLHHRNLVKLIGICSEDHFRCLVYELVPNGSLESHLHGVDKEASPLDWCARMKIALGAARGLAYLHEDSNPRVIHRDFKSSNILLENDFTPKVSDFGLARTALDEGNKHISTHVMGTFGYLAPEYAMTGHLLVKSDVYSYGVVLLELLTGRKPVDLSQQPGQENLVAWARPLLSSQEGLESVIDSNIKSNIPFDSIVKVAAIASMCVQPEVSHRPFMGEVVQALKLVCNEFEEIKETISRSCSQEEFDVDVYSKHSRAEYELVETSQTHYPVPGYSSVYDTKMGLSTSDLKGTVDKFEGMESESFRRQFNSAPLKMGRRRQFWQRLRGLSKGSMSEHAFSSNL